MEKSTNQNEFPGFEILLPSNSWNVMVDMEITSGKDGDPIYGLRAIVDTGSSHTMISKEVAQALNFKPIEDIIVNSSSGQHGQKVYEVALKIEGNPWIPRIQINDSEHLEKEGFHALLGFDIISISNFSIDRLSDGTIKVKLKYPAV